MTLASPAAFDLAAAGPCGLLRRRRCPRLMGPGGDPGAAAAAVPGGRTVHLAAADTSVSTPPPHLADRPRCRRFKFLDVVLWLRRIHDTYAGVWTARRPMNKATYRAPSWACSSLL